MANIDLINFYTNYSKGGLDKIKRETQNKSIYETLRSWKKYGYIRRIKPDRARSEFNTKRTRGSIKRVYQLTTKGESYVRYKRENPNKITGENTTSKIEKNEKRC